MSQDHWSLLVWVGAFVGLFTVLETWAVWFHAPWWTLSATSWDLEEDFTVFGLHPFQIVFLIGLGLLQVHIVARWP